MSHALRGPGNGRRRIWVPGSDRDGVVGGIEPDAETLRDYLQRPNMAVSRAELGGILESFLLDGVAPLVREALTYQESRRWYRRLWRALRPKPKPRPAPPEAPGVRAAPRPAA